MKIIRLEIQNFKRIRAVDITPPEHLVRIVGANEQGKSSVLDSILDALGGRKSPVTLPLRQGEQSGLVRVQFEDIIVTCEYREGRESRMIITAADGGRYASNLSPQKFLDSLIGDISFDPLMFSRLEPTRQRDLILQTVPFTIDVATYIRIMNGEPPSGMDAMTALDQAKKTLFSLRTDVNRDATRCQKTLENFRGVRRVDKVEISNLLAERDSVQKRIQEIGTKQTQLRGYADNQRRLKDEIEDLRKQIESRQETLKQVTEKGLAIRDELIGVIVPSTQDIDTQIANAEKTNQEFAEYLKKVELEAEIQGHLCNSEILTRRLGLLDELKKETLRNSPLPVEGLEITDTGILVNGIPYNQLSQSQRILISTQIGMAMNPTIRILCIRDGGLLDNAHIEILSRLAEENDFQIWLEIVDDDGDEGIVIEDGMVRP